MTNYADLPITEFRELHDAVTNIARLAKLKNKLLSNKDQRDWESAQAGWLEQSAGRSPKVSRCRSPMPT